MGRSRLFGNWGHVVVLLAVLVASLLSQATPTSAQQTNSTTTRPTTAVTTTGAPPTLPPRDLWAEFKKQYDKSFSDPEVERQHWKNFLAAQKLIMKHNSEPSNRNKLALNKRADMSEEDKIHYTTGFVLPKKMFRKLADLQAGSLECIGDKSAKKEAKRIEKLALTKPAKHERRNNLPNEFSWLLAAKNRVGPVEDQGECGFSWAFAATGVLEGQRYRFKNTSMEAINLSEQNILDCSDEHISCHSGGSAYEAFNTIEKLDGLMLQEDYSHSTKRVKSGRRECKFNKKRAAIKGLGGAMCLVPQDGKHDDLVKTFLMQYGPVAATMHAGKDQLFLHSSGIYRDNNCSKSLSQANHEVLLVGFGRSEESKLDYWIAKNSWGSDWGERGYFKIAMGTCGIGAAISFAMID